MKPHALSTRDAQLPAAYSDRLESLSLAPLWTALHALLPPERQTRVVPHRWRWNELRAPLLEAASLVPIEQAERRVLVLCNPGLPGNFSATATLYAGLQIILPGEAAPSHHHTAAALRLIVEGAGAYTTVDGVKCAMEPGDFIITPQMRWHDHGHEGREPVIWLDGLDIPLVRNVEANWASAMKPASTPATETDSSQDELTAAGLVPRQSRYEETGYPQVRWPWRTARAALAAMAATAPPARPGGAAPREPAHRRVSAPDDGLRGALAAPRRGDPGGAPHRERGGPRDRGAGREPRRRPDAGLAGRRRLRGATVALDHASESLGPGPRLPVPSQRRARAARVGPLS